jgi:hypothetical protein
MVVVTENASDVQLLTLKCHGIECLTQLRIGRFLKLPVTRVGAFRFCPICGGPASAAMDVEESYWETLAKAYGITVEAVIAIHSIWNGNEYPKFSDFVKVMLEEARDTLQRQVMDTAK